MSKAIYDAEASVLVFPQQTLTTDTTGAVCVCLPSLLATSWWTLDVQAITATTTLTAILEASDVSTGPFSEVSRFVWPTGSTMAQQLALGVNGNVTRVATLTSRARYLRQRCLVGGAGASVTLLAWLGKPAGAVGLGVRARDSAVGSFAPLTMQAEAAIPRLRQRR